jgi:hypothetical protein
MKRNSFFIVSLFVATFLNNFESHAQISVANAQAIFIYNFTRMVDWPESYRSGDFIIGVLGNCELQGTITDYTNNKKTGNQNIVIKKFASVEDITKCHILFVPFSKNKLLPDVANKLNGHSTLLIAERSGAIEAGAGINFILKDDKLKFEVRTANITKYGLKTHSNLESMGIAK